MSTITDLISAEEFSQMPDGGQVTEHSDKPPLVLSAADELALPELLGDFRVAVRQVFEA